MREKSYLDRRLEDPVWKKTYIREGFRVEIEERDGQIATLTAKVAELEKDERRNFEAWILTEERTALIDRYLKERDKARAEASAMAAVACPHDLVVGDDGGTPYCQLMEAAKELVEVATLRGDNDLPHPANSDEFWTARMQTAWDEIEKALTAMKPVCPTCGGSGMRLHNPSIDDEHGPILVPCDCQKEE